MLVYKRLFFSFRRLRRVAGHGPFEKHAAPSFKNNPGTVGLPILCYHQVASAAAVGRYLNIGPERLDSHARHFRNRGFKFLRARDLVDGWPSRSVVLTFDDAYASTLSCGLEILLRYGAVASVFAVAGKVGAFNDWDGPGGAPLADWEALLEAERKGIEIGNHTLDHANLTLFEPADALRRIEEGHRVLIDHGLTPGSIAYPYGAQNEAVRNAAMRAGYQIGLALGTRTANSGDDQLALPRIVVGFGDALPKLLYKMHIRPKIPLGKRREHYVR